MNNKLARKLVLGGASLLVLFLMLPFLPQQDQRSSISAIPTQGTKLPQAAGTVEPPFLPAPVKTDLVRSSGIIENAYRNRTSSLLVKETGTVSKILADDNKGSRHQRFIVRLQSGHTVLIAHNIDLAPRISNLREGDQITFAGQYEWNEQGGVVHWTHHDPARRHAGGYLLHNNVYYQ